MPSMSVAEWAEKQSFLPVARRVLVSLGVVRKVRERPLVSNMSMAVFSGRITARQVKVLVDGFGGQQLVVVVESPQQDFTAGGLGLQHDDLGGAALGELPQHDLLATTRIVFAFVSSQQPPVLVDLGASPQQDLTAAFAGAVDFGAQQLLPSFSFFSSTPPQHDFFLTTAEDEGFEAAFASLSLRGQHAPSPGLAAAMVLVNAVMMGLQHFQQIRIFWDDCN